MAKRLYLILILGITIISILLSRVTAAWFTSERSVQAQISAATLGIDIPLNDINLGKVYPGYVINKRSVVLQNSGDLDLKFKASFSTEDGVTKALLNGVMVKIYTLEEKDAAPTKSLSEWMAAPYFGAKHLKVGEQSILLFDFSFDPNLTKVDFQSFKSLTVTLRATQVENNEIY